MLFQAEELELELEPEPEQEPEPVSPLEADSEMMNIHLNSVFSTNANSVGINYTVAFIIQKYGFTGTASTRVSEKNVNFTRDKKFIISKLSVEVSIYIPK